MAEEQELSVQEIAELRDRWKTEVGLRVKKQLLLALRNGDDSWPNLLSQLPNVGVAAPYPEALDDLRGLDLCEERLERVSLTHSDLSFASFHLCNLTKARFQYSKLSWAQFSRSNLTSADLLQVTADHGRFDRCSLRGAMMMTSNFRHGSFKGSDLRSSVLNGCDFRDCDLADVKLKGAEAYSVKMPPSFDLESHLTNSAGPSQPEPR
ncbi:MULTISPECIES: pentapeptide repeat-containing protein [Pseudomonas]|jgi:uncharacterized protein YjbI with pentapeptide repeats|uniref:Pentapeptide repeat-containing protein n=1 Tax=Pseudomonas poae TaxID=200451 RepID=A0A2S9ETI2_9PSED|nr:MULTISPECIES: pentapeptide repeat-containing protein [Pseudomonas]MCT4498041.1 pentapeptide repeat-containing protein [Pseudomonas sivasensis]PRA28004.1 hypothetical protein CQZ97_16970 [Pseudomonas poae]PRC19107.1 hypothetical protein CQZ99_12440 [Pseudomonas poae]